MKYARHSGNGSKTEVRGDVAASFGTDTQLDLAAAGKPQMPASWVVCRQCEEVDTPLEKMPGNGWVEGVLYLFWIAPGVVYSVWRRKSKKKVCSACESPDIVPVASRAGAAAGPPATMMI